MKLDPYTRCYLSCAMKKRVLRFTKGKGYYFDDNGVYCSGNADELEKLGIRDARRIRYRITRSDLYQPDIDGISSRIVMISITRLEVGDTIDKFFEFIETAKTNRIPLPTGIDRFITRIDTPSIEREIGNKDKNTFDFIYVDVCIIQLWDTDKKEYIKANIQEIKKRVLEKIENSNRFKRYGVPINFLKLTSITLTRDDVLHFIFELKEIK